MGYIDRLERHEVTDPVSFAEYVRQETGTPHATGKDMAILRKKLREFFGQYPHLDYAVLVSTVDWCKSKKRRFAHSWQVISQFRYAWKAGALPDFQSDPVRALVDRGLTKALEKEEDIEWRTRLAYAQSGALTPADAQKVFDQWREERAVVA